MVELNIEDIVDIALFVERKLGIENIVDIAHLFTDPKARAKYELEKEKLAELMGQKAFEEWFAQVREEVAVVSMEEVDMAKRIAEEKAGVTFKEVFGEEETFS